MPLDPSAVGATTEPSRHSYGWKDVVLYALGIGAGRAELPYLYEQSEGGLRVFPTYAVIPAFPVVVELLARAGADMPMVLHGAQRVVAHAPIPAEAALETTGALAGIYDLKKLAQIDVATRTTCEGRLLFETEWTIFVRGAGGVGARRAADPGRPPRLPRERIPDWVVEQAIAPEQALLYRLSGDTNPLHADPTVAARAGFGHQPILHGLCTYGFMARALVAQAAGGDSSRLRSLHAAFRRPVWPGDTLVTRGHDLGEGQVGLVSLVQGRPNQVVANAWAEIAPPIGGEEPPLARKDFDK
jgi:acyl dehydratase